MNIISTVKPHGCHLCAKSFSRRYNLRRHVDIVHSGEVSIEEYSEDSDSKSNEAFCCAMQRNLTQLIAQTTHLTQLTTQLTHFTTQLTHLTTHLTTQLTQLTTQLTHFPHLNANL